MSFMVNFRSAEGKPGYHPTDSLEEAVRFVEHLRNQEQVADARVWRLQEVPLEVKTYYKVVVPTGVPAVAPAPAPEPATAMVTPPAADDSAPKGDAGGEAVGAAGSNGARFGRFNRT
ncbi:MAG: hypothetical protein ACR2MO_17285 [Acidimicrobiales bacterium]